jgi:hypothetical protein
MIVKEMKPVTRSNEGQSVEVFQAYLPESYKNYVKTILVGHHLGNI